MANPYCISFLTETWNLSIQIPALKTNQTKTFQVKWAKALQKKIVRILHPNISKTCATFKSDVTFSDKWRLFRHFWKLEAYFLSPWDTLKMFGTSNNLELDYYESYLHSQALCVAWSGGTCTWNIRTRPHIEHQPTITKTFASIKTKFFSITETVWKDMGNPFAN